MLRGVLSVLICGAALILAGCQGDERQQVVKNVIKQMGDTKSRLTDIRGKVEEAVSKGKAQEDGNFKLDPESLEAAKKLMKDLKDDKDGPVKKMLDYENDAKRGKPLTEQEKRDMAAANKGPLDRAISDLTEEYALLKKALLDAGKKDKQGGQELDEELTNALGDLEKIAQRR